ncbi:MAG: hypothetical protein KDK08_28040 [Rhizobiaceae bacterium]|nr:hypothetical protein [Rhizobiaceae bacterium]
MTFRRQLLEIAVERLIELLEEIQHAPDVADTFDDVQSNSRIGEIDAMATLTLDCVLASCVQTQKH